MADGPSRRRPKGEQTRRAILDAAIARFGREGYRATSVADIARDAGVGGTVAYAYFPNKEALFLAAIDEDAAAVISEGLLARARRRRRRRLARDADLHAGRRRRATTRWPAGCSPASSPTSPTGCSRSRRWPSCARPCAERLRAEQLDGHGPARHRPGRDRQRRRRHHALAADVGGAARRRRRRSVRERHRRGLRGRARPDTPVLTPVPQRLAVVTVRWS